MLLLGNFSFLAEVTKGDFWKNFFEAPSDILFLVPYPIICFVLLLVGIWYRKSLKKSLDYEEQPKCSLLIFLFVKKIIDTCISLLGEAYSWIVPFFLYVIALFWISGILSIAGLPSLGTNIWVPFSLAVMVYLGTIVFGIVNRKGEFLNDYVTWFRIKKRKIFPIPDPLKFLGEVGKVVSLSCRLWGNALAGALIICLVYNGMHHLVKDVAWAQGLGVLVVPILVFPLHLYFDILDTTIQAVVFFLLSVTYLSLGAGIRKTDNKYSSKELKLEQNA